MCAEPLARAQKHTQGALSRAPCVRAQADRGRGVWADPPARARGKKGAGQGRGVWAEPRTRARKHALDLSAARLACLLACARAQAGRGRSVWAEPPARGGVASGAAGLSAGGGRRVDPRRGAPAGHDCGAAAAGRCGRSSRSPGLGGLGGGGQGRTPGPGKGKGLEKVRGAWAGPGQAGLQRGGGAASQRLGSPFLRALWASRSSRGLGGASCLAKALLCMWGGSGPRPPWAG